MHAHPLAIHLAILAAGTAAATVVASQPQPGGPITSADAAMRYHLSLEYKTLPLRLWPPARTTPCGAASPGVQGASADACLNQIVRSHTREMLDRGRWINPWLAPGEATAGAR